MILNEEMSRRFAAAMIDAPALRISAANWVEAAIVVDSHRNPAAKVRFEDLVDALRLEIMPVTVEDAYRTAHRLQ